MMHKIITLEGEDPRLTEMFSVMRLAKPKYGLGYLEKDKGLIPACRFGPVPDNCKKPTVMEMHKFFTLMSGCLKSEVSSKWMKAMLNWDLFTNPEAKEFGMSHTIDEKRKLAEDWKRYMEVNNSWISFYEWKKNVSPLSMLTGSSYSSSVNKHAWTALDGTRIETPSTFPPYIGIIIGENQNVAKVIPFVQKDDNALGIDGRIQKASEQINWTNTAIKGLEINSAKAAEIKEQFDIVQVSINEVKKCLNDVHFNSSIVRSYAKESLSKIEGVEEKLVDHLDTTKHLISGLTEKVEHMSISKTKKPVPTSFL